MQKRKPFEVGAVFVDKFMEKIYVNRITYSLIQQGAGIARLFYSPNSLKPIEANIMSSEILAVLEYMEKKRASVVMT